MKVSEIILELNPNNIIEKLLIDIVVLTKIKTGPYLIECKNNIIKKDKKISKLKKKYSMIENFFMSSNYIDISYDMKDIVNIFDRLNSLSEEDVKYLIYLLKDKIENIVLKSIISNLIIDVLSDYKYKSIKFLLSEDIRISNAELNLNAYLNLRYPAYKVKDISEELLIYNHINSIYFVFMYLENLNLHKNLNDLFEKKIIDKLFLYSKLRPSELHFILEKLCRYTKQPDVSLKDEYILKLEFLLADYINNTHIKHYNEVSTIVELYFDLLKNNVDDFIKDEKSVNLYKKTYIKNQLQNINLYSDGIDVVLSCCNKLMDSNFNNVMNDEEKICLKKCFKVYSELKENIYINDFYSIKFNDIEMNCIENQVIKLLKEFSDEKITLIKYLEFPKEKNDVIFNEIMKDTTKHKLLGIAPLTQNINGVLNTFNKSQHEIIINKRYCDYHIRLYVYKYNQLYGQGINPYGVIEEETKNAKNKNIKYYSYLIKNEKNIELIYLLLPKIEYYISQMEEIDTYNYLFKNKSLKIIDNNKYKFYFLKYLLTDKTNHNIKNLLGHSLYKLDKNEAWVYAHILYSLSLEYSDFNDELITVTKNEEDLLKLKSIIDEIFIDKSFRFYDEYNIAINNLLSGNYHIGLTMLSVLFEGFFREFLNSKGINTFYKENNIFLENILSEDFLNTKAINKIPQNILNDIIYVLIGDKNKNNNTLSLRHKIWHGLLKNEDFNIENCLKILNLYKEISILYNNKDLD